MLSYQEDSVHEDGRRDVQLYWRNSDAATAKCLKNLLGKKNQNSA